MFSAVTATSTVPLMLRVRRVAVDRRRRCRAGRCAFSLSVEALALREERRVLRVHLARGTYGGGQHFREPAADREQVDDGLAGLDADELDRLDRLASGVALLILRRAIRRRERSAHARDLLVLRVRDPPDGTAEQRTAPAHTRLVVDCSFVELLIVVGDAGRARERASCRLGSSEHNGKPRALFARRQAPTCEPREPRISRNAELVTRGGTVATGAAALRLDSSGARPRSALLEPNDPSRRLERIEVERSARTCRHDVHPVDRRAPRAVDDCRLVAELAHCSRRRSRR